MSVFALLAPIALVAAMFFAIAYARRTFRPKPKRGERDLASHLGLGGPGVWTPPSKSRSRASDGAMDGRSDVTGGDSGRGQ